VTLLRRRRRLPCPPAVDKSLRDAVWSVVVVPSDLSEAAASDAALDTRL